MDERRDQIFRSDGSIDYAVVYYVMLWADKLQGSVAFVECDNTAAVAWLMKSRAAGGNLATDALAKIFSLLILLNTPYLYYVPTHTWN